MPRGLIEKKIRTRLTQSVTLEEIRRGTETSTARVELDDAGWRHLRISGQMGVTEIARVDP